MSGNDQQHGNCGVTARHKFEKSNLLLFMLPVLSVSVDRSFSRYRGRSDMEDTTIATFHHMMT